MLFTMSIVNYESRSDALNFAFKHSETRGLNACIGNIVPVEWHHPIRARIHFHPRRLGMVDVIDTNSEVYKNYVPQFRIYEKKPPRLKPEEQKLSDAYLLGLAGMQVEKVVRAMVAEHFKLSPYKGLVYEEYERTSSKPMRAQRELDGIILHHGMPDIVFEIKLRAAASPSKKLNRQLETSSNVLAERWPQIRPLAIIVRPNLPMDFLEPRNSIKSLNWAEFVEKGERLRNSLRTPGRSTVRLDLAQVMAAAERFDTPLESSHVQAAYRIREAS